MAVRVVSRTCAEASVGAGLEGLLGGFEGEELEGAALAVAKVAASWRWTKSLSASGEGARGSSYSTSSLEEGAAAVGLDGVAVAPVSEGAAELDVAEAFEPAEVFDEGVPGEADGGEGDGADGEGEARAGAGGDAVGAGEGFGWWRGRDVGGVLDAGVLPGGHEAGEVGGVGEESEDLLDGVGEALFGLEVEAHGFTVSVLVGRRWWVSAR